MGYLPEINYALAIIRAVAIGAICAGWFHINASVFLGMWKYTIPQTKKVAIAVWFWASLFIFIFIILISLYVQISNR